MATRWTGGQYSVLRVVLAASTIPWLVGIATVAPEPSTTGLAPWFPNPLDVLPLDAARIAVPTAGGVLLVALALGRLDRLAAVLLAALLMVTRGLMPEAPGVASWPLVESMLLLHALLPAAPYGSLRARGRADPDGGWRFPTSLRLAAWLVVGLAHLGSAFGRLLEPGALQANVLRARLGEAYLHPWAAEHVLPLLSGSAAVTAAWALTAFQIAFLPAALGAPTRRWAWFVVLAIQIGALLLLDQAGAGAMALAAHLYLVEPGWLPTRRPARPERIFYDGQCALCHGAVRFVLAEDRDGELFAYAPLHGVAFREEMPEAERDELPDSLVVRTGDGRTLARWRAVRHVLRRLGGLWRLLGGLGGLLPAALGDRLYDLVARIRYRAFGRKASSCPLMPPDLRARFDLRP